MSVTEVGTSLGISVANGNTTGVTGSWNGNQPRTKNDELIACVTTWGTTTGAIGSFTPAGWTQRAAITSGDGRGVTAIYTKIASGGDAAPTFTPNNTGTSASAQTTIELHELTGQDTTGPIASTGTGTSTTSPVTITTAGNINRVGCFAITSVLAALTSAATGTYTPGTSWTNFDSQAAISQRPHAAVDTLSNPATGGTLSEAPTWSGGTLQGFTGSMVVIQPPPGTPQTTQVPVTPRRPRRAFTATVTGSSPAAGTPGTPNRQPNAGPRPRPPQRALTAILRGRGPLGTPGTVQPRGPRVRPPQRALTAILRGSYAPATTPGTPNRQPNAGPRPRPPQRALTAILRGRGPLGTPTRQGPAFIGSRRRLQRATVLLVRGRAAPAPGGGGAIIPLNDDDRPWLKRMRVKWYRHGPALDSWYDTALPAGVASAYTAGGRLAAAGAGQAAEDVAAAIPARADIPADSTDADRGLRRRAVERIRRGRRYRPGRPVWSRYPVVPATGDPEHDERSERLIDSYRLPRPGWRSPSEYPLPVVQRRKRRAGDSGAGPAAGGLHHLRMVRRPPGRRGHAADYRKPAGTHTRLISGV